MRDVTIEKQIRVISEPELRHVERQTEYDRVIRPKDSRQRG